MKNKAVIYSLWAALLLGGGILLINWRQRAANTAIAFINQMEIGNNQGFANSVFEKMLMDVGWRGGEAWCMYFVKAVYMQAFPKKAAAISKILTGSTQQSLKNAMASPDVFKVVTDGRPRAGDIVIWQSISNAANGHAGIVIKNLSNDTSETVEGNTSLAGQREGQGVMNHDRILKIGYINHGLKVLAFLRLKL